MTKHVVALLIAGLCIAVGCFLLGRADGLAQSNDRYNQCMEGYDLALRAAAKCLTERRKAQE